MANVIPPPEGAELVNRGDPDAYDFTLGDFIRDSAWHDLDLSAIIPVGTRAIIFNTQLQSTTTNISFWMRSKPYDGRYKKI